MHPINDAKQMLKNGVAKALETAKSNLAAAYSGDCEVEQVHALLVVTYLQGYANGKGFNAVLTPAQFVRMQLDNHPYDIALGHAKESRNNACSDDEYAFYDHVINILEGT